MVDGYLAVERRCAVRVADLKLPISDQEALLRLELKGFRRIEVDLLQLARLSCRQSRYQRGARTELAPGVVDCSSLVKWLYGRLGVWLPRHSLHQRLMGCAVSAQDLRLGDLLFTEGAKPYYVDDSGDGVGHVGMATGEGTVIHAANAVVNVVEVPTEQFVGPGFRGARRILLPGTVVLESTSGRRAECSLDYRCFVLQTLGKKLS